MEAELCPKKARWAYRQMCRRLRKNKDDDAGKLAWLLCRGGWAHMVRQVEPVALIAQLYEQGQKLGFRP